MIDPHLFWFHVNGSSNSWDMVISTLTLKTQGQGHGCGKRLRSHSQSGIQLIYFFFIPHQSLTIRPPIPQIQLFQIWPWKSKVKVMHEVKDQGSYWVVGPASKWCTSYLFPIKWTILLSMIWPIGREKNVAEILRIHSAKKFPKEFLQN